MRAKGRNLGRAIAAATAMMLLAGCQSTTQDSDSDNGGDGSYPDSANSPGITDSEITVSLPGISDTANQYYRYYGAIHLALEEMATRVNEDGGITGHTINPAYPWDAVDQDADLPVRLRQLCEVAVRQKHSFAVVSPFLQVGVALMRQAGCLGPARSIQIISDTIVAADDLAKTLDLVAPYALDDVTAGHVMIQRLSEDGFFDGASRIAILSPIGDYADTVRGVVVPELDAAGVTDPLVINGITTTAEINAAVLKMKDQGVDRVIYFDNSGAAVYLAAMADQNYTPPVAGLVANALEQGMTYGYPADKIYTLSWLEDFEVLTDGNVMLSNLPETPASQDCTSLAESTGTKVPGVAVPLLLTGCDSVSLVDAAIDASGEDDPSSAAFFEGLASLDRFESAFGVPLDFSQSRTGASQVWMLRGDEGCQCLEISGGPYPIDASQS